MIGRDGAAARASDPVPPAMDLSPERIGGFPKARILRDPGVRFGFGGKTGGRFGQSACPGHLHDESVVVSLDHANNSPWLPVLGWRLECRFIDRSMSFPRTHHVFAIELKNHLSGTHSLDDFRTKHMSQHRR